MDLTQEIILQHGRSSPYRGRLEDADVSVELENAVCGDSLTMQFKIQANEVTEAAFEGEGCLISQAAGSLLIGKVKRVKDLKKIRRFNDKTVFKLLEIELTLSRVKCALLSLQALKKAIS